MDRGSMDLDGYRCWLISIDVMKDAAWPGRAAAERALGCRHVVYCDAAGAPRGAARFPELDGSSRPAACDVLLFRPMGLLGDRVYAVIASIAAARTADLLTSGGALAAPRLGELQSEILTHLKAQGRYPDDRSIFGRLGERSGTLPAILYLQPRAAHTPAARGHHGTAVIAEPIADDAPFPFSGVVLFGQRPPTGANDVELPLVTFYLLNTIAIYHWCRYGLDLLASAALPSPAGNSESAYRAFFNTIQQCRARLAPLQDELACVRAEAASCRRFFAQLAAPAPAAAEPAPARPPPEFNLEMVDDLLQQLEARTTDLIARAATLDEKARQSYQAWRLDRQTRRQRWHLVLTGVLLALVAVLLLDSPTVRLAFQSAVALLQHAAAVAVFDPLLERLLAGLLPGQ